MVTVFLCQIVPTFLGACIHTCYNFLRRRMRQHLRFKENLFHWISFSFTHPYSNRHRAQYVILCYINIISSKPMQPICSLVNCSFPKLLLSRYSVSIIPQSARFTVTLEWIRSVSDRVKDITNSYKGRNPFLPET